ncbi:MAG TPA: histone H1 [Sulfuricella sp.]|nr:histone H1 [Sulfuricella sp.]
MPKRSSKGRLDLSQLAKSIVDQATGEEPAQLEQPEKNPAAVALGRLGGLKGGAARAKKLTAEKRSEIAKKAATARWAASREESE